MNTDTPLPGSPQAQLEEIRYARLASSRPALARPVSAVSAVCVGSGVALLAQGGPGWTHLAFLAAGVALIAVAHTLSGFTRRRRGLFGYRGWTKMENTTFLACAGVLMVTGFSGGTDLALIFVALGAVSAVAWYLMLRGVLVSDGQRRA